MGVRWIERWKQEFTVRKLHLSLHSPELLLQPQWNLPHYVWLLYRLFMLAYTVGWCVYCGLLSDTPKWLIYFSNITYCLMAVYYLVAFCSLAWACLLLRFFCQSTQETSSPGRRPEGDGHEPTASFPLPVSLAVFLQLQWFLHVLIGSSSLSVSFLYWTINYPSSHNPLSAHNINLHIVNALQVLLEYGLSATPVHLSHYLFLLLASCLYFLFAFIYWLGGFTNILGKPYIYPVLDFGGHPLVASVCVLGIALVCLPFFHFLLWNLHLLRVHLATSLRGGRLALRRETWWWSGVGGRLTPVPASHLEMSTSMFAVRGGRDGVHPQSPLNLTAYTTNSVSRAAEQTYHTPAENGPLSLCSTGFIQRNVQNTLEVLKST